jgi:hypothetical protein
VTLPSVDADADADADALAAGSGVADDATGAAALALALAGGVALALAELAGFFLGSGLFCALAPVVSKSGIAAQKIKSATAYARRRRPLRSARSSEARVRT